MNEINKRKKYGMGKKEKEQRLHVRKKRGKNANKKGKKKGNNCSENSPVNGQPTKAQTKNRTKYYHGLIFVRKHALQKSLISTGTAIQTPIFCL